MSSQRRETRWQRTSCTERAEAWSGSLRVTGARQGGAIANGTTAPPEPPASWVTDSLHKDRPIEQLVGQDDRCGTPPSRAGSRAAVGTPANRRSSLPHIPIPPGLASFHPASPQAPAAYSRRAERYDGKGNLYLLYAA